MLVVPVRGEISFEHDETRSSVAKAGAALTLMGPSLRHAVEARTDSALLLIIGARA